MQITPSSNLISALSAFSQTARAQAPQASPAAQTRLAPKPAAEVPKMQAEPPGQREAQPLRRQPLGQHIDIRV
ncbi:MAG: hypothetical protein KIT81_13530 [Alphaproteobacteria bacterium]|nr:hypothetical protein [Alphaproteobacteria bacterium]